MYLKSDDPTNDIRTLNNATCQFWSIITYLTINKIHQLIDKAGLQNDIKCISSIYDSIYFTVRADANLIKWLNDNIVPIITQDFMVDQAIHNEAAGEIGPDWATLCHVPNNASIYQIDRAWAFSKLDRLVWKTSGVPTHWSWTAVMKSL